MQNYYLLSSTTLVGGQDPAETSAEVQQPTTTSETLTTDTTDTTTTYSGGGMGGLTLIMIYVVILGAMYYFTIRPSRKREQLIQTKQSEIKVGDKVVTTSGMYGKVVDINDDSFNIEFGANKSIIIPVVKRDVLPVGVQLDPKAAKKEALAKAKAEAKEAKEEKANKK